MVRENVGGRGKVQERISTRRKNRKNAAERNRGKKKRTCWGEISQALDVNHERAKHGYEEWETVEEKGGPVSRNAGERLKETPGGWN